MAAFASATLHTYRNIWTLMWPYFVFLPNRRLTSSVTQVLFFTLEQLGAQLQSEIFISCTFEKLGGCSGVHLFRIGGFEWESFLYRSSLYEFM